MGAQVLYRGDFNQQKSFYFHLTLTATHKGAHSTLTTSSFSIQLFYPPSPPPPVKKKKSELCLFCLKHIHCSLCAALGSPITSPRLRGHLAAVDRREQLSTGPCRGGVSQTPHPKHLWRLIHCSSGLRSPRTACNCHRDQYALG